VAVVVGSLAKLGKHIESFYDLMASVDKLGSLFDLPIDRTDGLLTMGPESVSLRRTFAIRCQTAGKS
jgi:putative ABC transport system ATP-binding protein